MVGSCAAAKKQHRTTHREEGASVSAAPSGPLGYPGVALRSWTPVEGAIGTVPMVQVAPKKIGARKTAVGYKTDIPFVKKKKQQQRSRMEREVEGTERRLAVKARVPSSGDQLVIVTKHEPTKNNLAVLGFRGNGLQTAVLHPQ